MNRKLYFVLLIAATLLAACNIPVSMMGGSGSASIIEPLDGSHWNVGDLIDVKTLVDYPSGASSAILLVNDSPYRSDNFSQPVSSGNIYQPWTPTEPGTFTLQTRLTGANGEIDSNSISVIVGVADSAEIATSESEPTATLPPDVTATSTIALPTLTSTPFVSTQTKVILPTLTSTVVVSATGGLSGLVYRDENGNGNFNPTDAPISGAAVQLGVGACPASGFSSTQTDGSGSYTFSGLLPGQYCITVNAGSFPSIGGTWQPSLPNPKGVSITEGEFKAGQNFMFQPIIQ